MQNAKCIVSINHNAASPIFDISHYGAVADFKAVLPAVIAESKPQSITDTRAVTAPGGRSISRDYFVKKILLQKEIIQMSERKQIIPQYGPFAGMRVIDSGSLIAMPYAATLLADFGAEVIHIERPGVGDTLRVLAPFAKEDGKTVSTSWAQDGRNKLSLSLELNLKHPEVKELFFGLIKEADVFMENMVWLEKLGIRDEELARGEPQAHHRPHQRLRQPEIRRACPSTATAHPTT